MKIKRIWIMALLIVAVSCGLVFAMAGRYADIHKYNTAAANIEWVRKPDIDYNYWMIGDNDEYFIKVNTFKEDSNGEYVEKTGVMDVNGKPVLPNKYDKVEYYGGEYIATIKSGECMIFDKSGKAVASFEFDKGAYSYAGDKYLIKYPNMEKRGFEIIDIISGETVKRYEDYYNAVLLDDGNWYISRTEDNLIAQRSISYGESIYGYEKEAEPDEIAGFFTDENLTPLFGGKEYRLACQGAGYYSAFELDGGKPWQYVMLDENGKLFDIGEKGEFDNKTGSWDSASGIIEDDAGNIGIINAFWDEDTEYTTIYYGRTGKKLREYKAYGNLDLSVYVSYDKNDEGLYGIKDKNGNVILPAAFPVLEIMPDGKTVIVDGEGVLRLKGR